MGFDLSPSLYPIICFWCLETASTSYRLLCLRVVRCSLFFHVGLLSPLLDFLHKKMDCSWAWIRWSIWFGCVFSPERSPMSIVQADLWTGQSLLSLPFPPLLGLLRIIENIFKATLRSLRCHTWDLSFRHCYTACRMLNILFLCHRLPDF